MRLVAISSVKNDRDIAEAFVRHTLAVCDHLVVADHRSDDGTRDALDALAGEGLPLTITSIDDITRLSSARNTLTMRLAAERLAPDWVLPLDVDEFLTVSRTELDAHLVGRDGPVLIPWRSYAPTPHDDPGDVNPVTRIKHRLEREHYPWSKVVVPGTLAATATLDHGSHGLVDGRVPPDAILAGVHLAHYPIRSADQYAAKVAIASLQWESHPGRGDLAFHYQAPFRRLLEGSALFERHYQDDALRYAAPGESRSSPELRLDPLAYRGGPLQHTPPTPAEPLPVILRYALDVAQAHARLEERLQDPEREPVAVTRHRDQTADDRATGYALDSPDTRLRQVEAERDALLASRSWRYTAPLRAIGRHLRQRRRR